MHDLLETAPHVPLSPNRVFIDGERLARLLDQLRTAIPDEIREAKGIIQQRDDLLNAAEEHATSLASDAERELNDARREAEAIMADAKINAEQTLQKADEEAQKRISSHEIVHRAEDRAVKLIEDAQHKADYARTDADEYIFEVLSSLEGELNRLLAVTRRGRSTLKRASANASADAAGKAGGFRRPGTAGPIIGGNQNQVPDAASEEQDEDSYVDSNLPDEP